MEPTGAVSTTEQVYITTKGLHPAHTLTPSDLCQLVGNYARHICLAHSFYNLYLFVISESLVFGVVLNRGTTQFV